MVELIVEKSSNWFKADRRVFDPAYGAGWWICFVQIVKFVERHIGMQRLSIDGQEKVERDRQSRQAPSVRRTGSKATLENQIFAGSGCRHGRIRCYLRQIEFVMADLLFNVENGLKLEVVGKHLLFGTHGSVGQDSQPGQEVQYLLQCDASGADFASSPNARPTRRQSRIVMATLGQRRARRRSRSPRAHDQQGCVDATDSNAGVQLLLNRHAVRHDLDFRPGEDRLVHLCHDQTLSHRRR